MSVRGQSSRSTKTLRTPPSNVRNNDPPASSCRACDTMDTDEMVQCDKCDLWYHFSCVGVTSSISEVPWLCPICIPKRTDEKASISIKSGKAPSNKTSSSRKRAQVALQILEEKRLKAAQRAKEQAIADAEYLKEKQTLLEQAITDSDDDYTEANDDAQPPDNAHEGRTTEWVNNSPDLRTNIAHTSELVFAASSQANMMPNTFQPHRNLTNPSQQPLAQPNITHAYPSTSHHIDIATQPRRTDFSTSARFSAAPIATNQMPTINNRTRNVELQPLSGNQYAARHITPKELPTFTGKPEEWPVFISSYENSTSICGFSDAENLIRLQRCLKGKALEAVSCRLMIPSTVPDVINTLRLLFGRPEQIIYSMLEKIRSEPSPKADNLSSIIKFALSVQNVCGIMEASGLNAHINNPMLLQELVAKLPASLALNWGMANLMTPNSNISQFSNWLYKMAEAASVVSIGVPSTVDDVSSERRTSKKGHLNAHAVQSDSNETDIVKQMEKLSRHERWNLLKQKGLCRKCFGKHHSNRCKQSTVCGKNGCQFKHHRLLHNDDMTSTVAEDSSKPNTTERKDNRQCNAHQQSRENSVLFRIVPVTLFGKTKQLDTYAFLDDGSSITMMEQSVAEELELNGTLEELCLKWTADVSREEPNSQRVSVGISSQSNKDRRYQLHDVRTVSALNLPLQTMDSNELTTKYHHLRNIPFHPYSNANPKILIGLDNWKLCISSDVREGKWKEPVATKTRLGWTVYGQYHHHEAFAQPVTHHSLHICDCKNDENLQSLVKEFFSIENFGVRPTKFCVESTEEKRAKAILDETTIRSGERYETGLLWRYDQVTFPDSRPMAIRRLACLERKMRQDSKLRENLRGQIKDYVKKGYARKLTVREAQMNSPRTWYLPLFSVKNPNKPDKIRMVWDAAAKVDGVSLNSFLLKGPDQLVPLPYILFGFRQRSVAISADICEMFHQVRIRQDDQHSQRFLWRSETGEIDTYVMQVMTFGATCSPCSAHYVKDQNALRFKEEYPRAVNAIVKHHYVDDLLYSVDTTEEAIKLAKDIRFIHKQGGFVIRHWLSNSPTVAREMEEGEPPKTTKLIASAESTTEKVLGMHWRTETDEFTYSIRINNVNKHILIGKRRPTKREVLRTLMSVFDPLGFLAAFLVHIKILLKDIWRSTVGWDEQIEDMHYEKWLLWLNLLPKIEEIRIPRCYRKKTHTGGSTELHIFVDASENAYAAVAYFRVEKDDVVECAIVGAKTKVAPQQPMSIPRLELQAAVLGTRLASSICSGHDCEIKRRVFWSDSKTVLCWLKADPNGFRQFVALRIGEILESSDLTEWRWIPTKENVADDATKWKNDPDVSSESRWFTGPEFLLLPESSWPADTSTPIKNTDELRPHHIHTTALTSPCTVDEFRISTWNRLLRAQALVCRAIDIFKCKTHKPRRVTGPLTSNEYSRAEMHLLKKAQIDQFQSEVAILQRNKNLPPNEQTPLPKSSALYTLSPYIDDHGLLRMQSRIDAAHYAEEDAKRPFIMPRNHRITFLIIQSFHNRYHHQNHETVINEIRQKFYIPRLRQALKPVRSSCQRCKIDRAMPQPPKMADLPAARLAAHTRPFTYVGLDYFGPIIVTVGRRSEKRWCVLITCLTIRAIHLEIAHSLNTDSCIMCLRNFISRRGTPREIYCDNATNFHGAERELERSLKDVDFSILQECFENSTTKWCFNPPASPHMGGSWERLVGSVKKILINIMPTRNPNDEILRSMLAEAENVVNSKPLTHVSIEPGDEEALTPNHFLIGSSNGEKPPGHFTDTDLVLRKNWRKAQQLANQFWKRWIREYLPTITRRSKWFNSVKAIETGDIVVIADDNLPRNCWPMGRVISTTPGKNGQVRSASVQTKAGILTRPAVKLAVLDVYN